MAWTLAPVAACFDAAAIQEALRGARALARGDASERFRATAVGAGCAGYPVSPPGMRVLY